MSVLLTELPTYLKTVLHFDLKAVRGNYYVWCLTAIPLSILQNSLLSAMPYMAMWIFSIFFSLIADALRNKNILDTTQTRKLFNTVGM